MHSLPPGKVLCAGAVLGVSAGGWGLSSGLSKGVPTPAHLSKSLCHQGKADGRNTAPGSHSITASKPKRGKAHEIKGTRPRWGDSLQRNTKAGCLLKGLP